MKQFSALLLVAATILSLFAGCKQERPLASNGTQPSSQATATPTQPTDFIPPEPIDLTVSEVMADNEKLVLGHEFDWVELYNAELSGHNLENYYLTDNLKKPYQLPLAEYTVAADGYLVIVLDDEAPFRLSGDGETVYLTYYGQPISQLTFGVCQDGESFTAEGICTSPTPGFPNTEDGYLAYLESMPLPELMISEVMVSNSRYLPVNGQYYDWVEIVNNSDQPLDLSTCTLSDKHGELSRYRFPAVTLEAGGYFIVYCSGDPSLGEDHTGFKISSEGETLYLSKNGALVDVMTVPGDLSENDSYGRQGKLFAYLEKPTPGADNVEGFASSLASPSANVASGVYMDSFTVELSGKGTIYYTTDGSKPTVESKVYSKPLTISRSTTLRLICTDGKRFSRESAFTYIIDPESSLPILSITGPEDDMETIMTTIEQTIEGQVQVTLIENGEQKFSVPCGFRLHGNDSRKAPKQNFQLRFRAKYGAGKLHYKLFDDLDIDSFNGLVLKGGSEEWFSTMLRDTLAAEIVNGNTHLYTQATKTVVLYLNGEYWGIYYIREHFSDEYVADHLNVSEESVDLLKYGSARAVSGSNKEYLALRTYCKNNDMSLEENYRYLEERIDVLSLMDWYICRSYLGDGDYDNIRRFRSSETDNKWRWMFYDMDWGMRKQTTWKMSAALKNVNGDHVLINAVVASEVGRDVFLKRYAELMGTVLNGDFINGKIDEMVEEIIQEIPKDRERWNRKLSRWEEDVQSLRNFAGDGNRTKNILQDLKECFSLSSEEMEYYFGTLMSEE